MKRKKRLVALMARAGASRYAGAERAFVELLQDNFPTWNVDLFVGDTTGDRSGGGGYGRRVILVDSPEREFGCWDALVANSAVAEAVGTADLVALSTAAFANDYTQYLSALSLESVGKIDVGEWVLGHIDFYDREAAFCGVPFQHWLRTSALLMTPSVLITLTPFVTSLPPDREMFGTVAEPIRAGGPVSAQYAAYILGWLTSEDGTGQGTTRGQLHELSDASLEEFRQKTKAILREQSVTRRLEAQAVPILDANFVNGLDARITKPIPWRVQVRCRSVDSAPVPLPRQVEQQLAGSRQFREEPDDDDRRARYLVRRSVQSKAVQWDDQELRTSITTGGNIASVPDPASSEAFEQLASYCAELESLVETALRANASLATDVPTHRRTVLGSLRRRWFGRDVALSVKSEESAVPNDGTG